MHIFRLEGDKLIIAQETNVELEQHLENWLENSPRALTQELLLWIGRQRVLQLERGLSFQICWELMQKETLSSLN